MTDKSPKLLVDALGAIECAQDFVEGCTFADYAEDKMRRSAVERQHGVLKLISVGHFKSGAAQYRVGIRATICRPLLLPCGWRTRLLAL